MTKTLLLLPITLPLTLIAKEQKPNVIIIYADDIGYGDLSCYGATKVKTPNLDRLAKEGRMFTDMHSASSMSTASRYGLITGEYPSRANVFSVATYKTPLLFSVDKLTLPKVMQRSGYKTAAVGKWHLGIGEKGKIDWNSKLAPGPIEAGFDYYFGLPTVSSGPPFVLVENHSVVGYDPSDPFVLGVFPPTKRYKAKSVGKTIGGAKSAHDQYVDEMLGTTFCEKSVEWIKQNKKNPFFLYLATSNVHHPFTPHPRFVGTSEAGIYGDFIHELDWIVGEILATLEKEKLDKKTIIMFSSDNGAMLNHGGQQAMAKGHKINGDLFGFKFDAWEGGHRIPLIVRYPGKIKAGSVSNQLICNVDMVHTMAALVGYELSEGDAVDSYNMLPVLLGETKKELRENLLVSAFKRSHTAYREGDWVYITASGGGGFVQQKPGDHSFGGYTAANYYNKENSDAKAEVPQKEQLYNLKDDPYQTTNLAESMPEKTQEMKNKLLVHKKTKQTR